jgi:hypothetical protein
MRPGHDTNVKGCSARIPGRLGAVPGNINANTSAQTKTSGVNEMNKDIIEDDGFITIYPEKYRVAPNVYDQANFDQMADRIRKLEAKLLAMGEDREKNREKADD